jgi:hypothetical protein
VKALPVALAVIFFIIAALYLIGILQIGVSGETHGPHVKHAVLFAVLGILSLVWMRFQRTAARAGR